MEKPDFPLPPGRYVVTGGRETTTVLTVAEDGDAWELADGAKLHDDASALQVRGLSTHRGDGCVPRQRKPSRFPCHTRGSMPDIPQLHAAGLLGGVRAGRGGH